MIYSVTHVGQQRVQIMMLGTRFYVKISRNPKTTQKISFSKNNMTAAI